MTTEDFKRKLTAILSADVVGYSRLMGEDEAATVKTLETYKGVMFSLIRQHRGRVVDSPGDNLLAEFGSVVDAVQCSVSIQKELQARNADLSENRRMEFRIGINLGDVIEEGDRIYGDGVNIAARLEALADPGGICISKTAFDHIESKLPLGYEFLGEQIVKNIAKPVGAYKVLMETRVVDAKTKREAKAVSFWRRKSVLSLGIIVILAIAGALYWNFGSRGPSIEPASIERMAYPLPDKPSIAILPFTNISGDPEQDYIGDGLSRNICDALSVSSQMFVIDRNATFIYKETPVKPQQVAKDLGVQYILDGSIQKSGDRLRVTAQLIDALAGHYLWSDKYEREMKELFELEDEITKKIVVSIRVELGGGEDIRIFAKSTEDLEAWKYFIRGKELYWNFVEEDNAKAREHYKTALKLDPYYVPAMSHLGFTYWLDSVMGWSDSPSTSMNRAFELAQKAVELDDQDPHAHVLLGYVFLYERQHEKAIIEGTRAITLNPNFAQGCATLGAIMSYCGQFDEAISMSKKGYRLNPNLNPVFLSYMARSYISLERYEEALEVSNEMEKHVLNGRLGEFMWLPPLYSSWVYQGLGREEEARAYMAEALKREPDLSLEWIKRLFPYKNPVHLERDLDAFRKAGMPEKPPGAVREKPSIAVLPFDDLSSEKDQEYFVLGLSEEILNCLAQMPNLTVIAKTSSFSFKGKDKTVQEIASVLGVDHILEGSVRKAGNALRITAQLVKAVDGSHLWSKTYDRELKDIFAVQEDIAIAVADELKVTFGIDQFRRRLGGTDNVEAYELYLFAKGLYFTNDTPHALEAIGRAIALDPEFALAWAYKAIIHWEALIFAPANIAPFERDASLNAALRAIELEPNLGEAYLSLGSSRLLGGEFIEAELAYRKGMELTTESINPWEYGICIHYNSVGYFKRAHEIIEAARRNDPLNKVGRAVYMSTLGLIGDVQGAEEEYERGKALFGDDWFWGDRWIIWLRLGAKDVVSRDEIPAVDLIHDVAKKYLESPEEGLAELRRLYISENNLHSGNFACIAEWAAYFDDPELALNAMERSVKLNASALSLIWHPLMKEVRQLPRFKELVRKIGLVAYWNRFGWPDLCRPVGEDDFECD